MKKQDPAALTKHDIHMLQVLKLQKNADNHNWSLLDNKFNNNPYPLSSTIKILSNTQVSFTSTTVSS